jgi:hypothetical protein
MTIDEFSKQLIEKALIQLDEKGKCNHSGAGSSCPLHGDADCNSSKQNRAEEFTAEGKNKEGKEQGADGKACWKGYKYAGTENGKDKCVKAGYEMEGGEELSERKDMPGNQEKIDANKNGKVDAHDFALLRARKSKKSVKEMWQQAADIVEAKNKTKIEVMPTINDNPTEQGEKESSEISSDAKNSKYDEKKKKMKEEVEPLEEKKLSAKEKAKKEKFVKGMKKKFGSFKSKYGEKAKDVMYGTATAMAKKSAK